MFLPCINKFWFEAHKVYLQPMFWTVIALGSREPSFKRDFYLKSGSFIKFEAEEVFDKASYFAEISCHFPLKQNRSCCQVLGEEKQQSCLKDHCSLVIKTMILSKISFTVDMFKFM